MSTRIFISSLALTLLLIIAVVVKQLPFFALLEFQLLWAIIIYIRHQSGVSLLVIAIGLFAVDAALGVNPSFSLLSFAIPGLAITLLSRIVPLTKQSPFWIARIFWLLLAIGVYYLLRSELHVLGTTMLQAQVLNLSILVLLTLLLGGKASTSNPEIVIG